MIKTIFDKISNFRIKKELEVISSNKEIMELSDKVNEVYGIYPYNEQKLAAVKIQDNYFIEMKTGEGKTITTLMGAILKAKKGKVYIVTVNEYLSKRDYEYGKKLVESLDMTASCVFNNQPLEEKIKAYKANIIYTTSTNLAFDYLKTNLVKKPEDEFDMDIENSFVIVDEADSVLIDDASTPLVISKQSLDFNIDYAIKSENIVKQLTRGEIEIVENGFKKEKIENGDYIYNESDNNIYLTSQGMEKVEKLSGLDSTKNEGMSFIHYMTNALKAKEMFINGRDYIVQDEMIVLIDQSTGRLTPDRSMSDGLQQAIQIKEDAKISVPNEVEGVITYQVLFRMFKGISGLSGTLMTEAEELNTIYNADTVAIPTHRPIIRKDNKDIISFTEKEKIKDILLRIKEETYKEVFRPILITTTTVAENENLAKELDKLNLKYNLLNAKNEALESEIIENAGTESTITLATNMAGRGVDISLTEKSKELGGLLVLGFGRNFTRRIDLQVMGRSGRQGEPGETQFFVSFEDNIFKIVNQRIQNLIKNIGGTKEELSNSNIVKKNIVKVQKEIEGMYESGRNDIFAYDEVLDKQRQSIYRTRGSILYTEDVSDFYKKISDLLDFHLERVTDTESFKEIFKIDVSEVPENFTEIAINNLKDTLKEIPEESQLQLFKEIYLSKIDKYWSNMLTHMEDLKIKSKEQSRIGYDPLTYFKKESFSMYENMLFDLGYEIMITIIFLEIRKEQ